MWLESNMRNLTCTRTTKYSRKSLFFVLKMSGVWSPINPKRSWDGFHCQNRKWKVLGRCIKVKQYIGQYPNSGNPPHTNLQSWSGDLHFLQSTVQVKGISKVGFLTQTSTQTLSFYFKANQISHPNTQSETLILYAFLNPNSNPYPKPAKPIGERGRPQLRKSYNLYFFV